VIGSANTAWPSAGTSPRWPRSPRPSAGCSAAHFFGFVAGLGLAMGARVYADRLPGCRAQRVLGLGAFLFVAGLLADRDRRACVTVNRPDPRPVPG
jgi:hypothetical protein